MQPLPEHPTNPGAGPRWLVIVLHDGHGHGANVAKIVNEIVPRLKDQGYHFVTIESMQRNRAL
jgi:peptidoglycan/xylan/chitin deacetylase (PgdA/CDA1 family)